MVSYLDFSKHHTVAWSSDLLGTEYGEHIFNIKLENDHDNGVVLGLGDFVEYNYFSEAKATGFEGKLLMQEAVPGMWQVFVNKAADGDVLILNVPETKYEFESEAMAERQFYNAAGDIARAYQLRFGDRFSLSKEGFTTEPTEADLGKTVTVDNATGKLVIA